MSRRRRRGLIRFLVLVGIVIVGMILISRAFSTRRQVGTEAFTAPRLPVMYVRFGDHVINRMYGFTALQDQKTARDHLTLLSADRQMAIEIRADKSRIESIRYEIQSLADGSFVENGTVTNLTEKEDRYEAVVDITTPILMNREYGIRFEMTTLNGAGEREVIYYYTRLIQQTGTNFEAYLQFAEHFYRSCLDKEEAASIAAYMETDSVASKGEGFDNITIRSNMDQLTWGNLAPTLYQEAVPQIKEINEQTASIVMDYIIAAEDADGATEYYNVHDFYRLRTNQGEIMLIDLQRRTEQIFDAKRSIYRKDSIDLGVRSDDLTYQVSPEKNFAAFVSGGDLWLYEAGDKGRATRVFSFRGEAKPDERTENRNYRICISDVSDEGDVRFVVYGYMNGGRHEGTNGITVYQYNAGENLLDERLFIATDRSFERLDHSMQKLAYLNDDNMLYTYTGRQITRTDTADGRSQVIKGDIDAACVAFSANQHYVAWMDEMQENASSNITLVNTNSGVTRRIEAPEGEKIKIIGFFNEDLVYGLARDADIVTDASGNTIFGIYQIRIEAPDGTVRKEYGSEGTYIEAFSWSESNLELNLARRTQDGFESYGNDHIINNEAAGDGSVVPQSDTNNRQGPVVILNYDVSGKIGSRVRRSELMEKGDGLSVTLQMPEDTNRYYYVYASGGLAAIVRDANEALQIGDGQRGVVLDEDQAYVYERGNWRSYFTIDTAAVPEALRTPSLDAAKIAEVIGEDYAVLNYTGCSIESIRYQISRGYPVIAKFAPDKNVLILGYDIFDNLWYYDSDSGEVVAIGNNDSTELFGEQGNVFLSYYQATEDAEAS